MKKLSFFILVSVLCFIIEVGCTKKRSNSTSSADSPSFGAVKSFRLKYIDDSARAGASFYATWTFSGSTFSVVTPDTAESLLGMIHTDAGNEWFNFLGYSGSQYSGGPISHMQMYTTVTATQQLDTVVIISGDSVDHKYGFQYSGGNISKVYEFKNYWNTLTNDSLKFYYYLSCIHYFTYSGGNISQVKTYYTDSAENGALINDSDIQTYYMDTRSNNLSGAQSLFLVINELRNSNNFNTSGRSFLLSLPMFINTNLVDSMTSGYPSVSSRYTNITDASGKLTEVVTNTGTAMPDTVFYNY